MMMKSLLLLLIGIISCSVAITPHPKWHVGYPEGIYGQVESVDISVFGKHTTVNAALFTKDLYAYSAAHGTKAFQYVSEGAISMNSAAAGNTLALTEETFKPHGRVAGVKVFHDETGTPTWTKVYNDTNIGAPIVDENGANVFFYTNTIANGAVEGSIQVLDAANGNLKKSIACPGGPSVVMMLTVDVTGKYIAYACHIPKQNTQTVYVHPLNVSQTQAFKVTTVYSAATGFTLSKGGKYFSYGVEELHVYKQDGLSYNLLFNRNPVSNGLARLVERVAISETHLIAGWITIDMQTKAQQSFIEYHNLAGAQPSTALWTYRLVKTTNPLQDGISDIYICNDQYVVLSTWGTESVSDPTVHAFDLKSASNSTMFTYHTPGSMMSGTCVYDKDTATLTTAVGGKRIHANQNGSGGDLYLFETPAKN